MITKTMPSTVEAGRTRIAELVAEIERYERLRNEAWLQLDRAQFGTYYYGACSRAADACDDVADALRAELRAILGVDPYRLADAIGA